MREMRNIAILLAFSVASCSGRPAPDAGAPARPDGGAPAQPSSVRWEQLLALEDARDVQGLSALARSSTAEERARVALALGRTQSPDATAPLRKLLVDEEPSVRDAAAFAVGLLGDAAGLDEERALLGRLAAERKVDGRVALTDALGRVGADASLPALAALLQDPEPRVREQAAVAVGSFALRGKPVDAERQAALLDRLAPSEPAPVRAAVAYALARITKIDEAHAQPIATALQAALGDADPNVRMFAARALAAHPPSRPNALAEHVDDPDWRVRVNVVRALAKCDGPAGAQGVRAFLERAFAKAREGGVGGADVHPLVAALEVAADRIDNPALRAVVTTVHEGALELRGPSTARDLVHCSAAFALDRAGNWPRFVTTCGTPSFAPEQRLAFEARLLGAAHGDDLARAGRLQRLYGSTAPLVRAAALEAVATIDAPPARALVRRGLADPDPAVVSAAAEAVAAHPERFARVLPAPPAPPAPPAADAGPAPAPPPADEPAAIGEPDPAIVVALVGLVDRLREGEESETLLSVIGALGALHAGPASRLVPLLRHPVLAVRNKAAEAYRTIAGESAPRPGPPLPPRRPLDAAAATRIAIGPPLTAVLQTTRGEVRLRLHTRETPGTVANFVTLARQGFYRGRAFHRVVANFVIQGGDPRGDGYGGPGWSIRCEGWPAPYRQGSVGMALAGPDTGGSQFFVMHSRHPHLDGRYTLFAEVVAGQEIVDSIVPGDALQDVRIE